MSEGDRTMHAVRKVPYQIFTWVVTILAGAMITIAGYLFKEFSELRTETNRELAIIEGRVRELDTKLDANSERGQTVRVDLAEIKATLTYLKGAADGQRPRR